MFPQCATESDSGAAAGRERVFGVIGGVVIVGAIVGALLAFQPFSHVPPVAASALGSTVVRPTPTTATKQPGPIIPPVPIASIGGAVVETTVRTFDDVVGLNFLTADQIAIYRDNGPITEVDFALAHSGPNRIVILLVRKPTAAVAKQTADATTKLLVDYGMTAQAGGPAGVHSQTADGAAGGPLRRAEYASGEYSVYVEVQGPNPPGVDGLLTSVLDAQLTKLPVR